MYVTERTKDWGTTKVGETELEFATRLKSHVHAELHVHELTPRPKARTARCLFDSNHQASARSRVVVA